MGLYRDETGLVFEADDAAAQARGYTPVSPGEEAEIYTQRGLEKRKAKESDGVGGAIRAGSNRFLSSATFGGTDVLLDGLMTPAEREQLQGDLAAHPYVSAIAEGAGALAPALAAPGSALARTPAGYLSRITGTAVEGALAEGGIGGTAKALIGMGTEGAAQSAGQYIGQSAIADKEVTAEGLAGALGTGYVFGAGGGGVALGVSKGGMAARRLFSRVMDGEKAATDAASAWSRVSEEALQADQSTAAALQTRLDDIQKAKAEAMRFRNEMKSSLEEERIRASVAEKRPVPEEGTPVPNEGIEGPVPLDEGIAPARGGGQTSIFRRPEPVTFDPVDAAAFDAGMTDRQAMRDMADQIPQPAGEKTGVHTPAGPNGTKVFDTKAALGEAGAATKLEEQLAGTKAALNEGKSLKDIGEIDPLAKEPPDGYVRKYAMKGGGPGGPSGKGGLYNEAPLGPDYLPTKRAPFSNLRAQLSQKLLPEMRESMTADLLGKAVAKEETAIHEALDELQSAREAMSRIDDDISSLADELPGSDTHGGTPKARREARERAMAQLDNAHEEALIHAQREMDPVKTGEWLAKAEHIETLMNDLPGEKDIYWDFGDKIRVVESYEKAIGKAADVAGDAAHPSARQIADAVADAEREGERQFMDRTARAADDAETFGPEYKTPKERVAYQRERVRGAQDAVNDLKTSEVATRDELGMAKRKVKAGEADKKAALKLDAQAAKAASAGSKMMDVGGMLEVFDIPGMPKPHDLPVIGPLLGAYLKYRTLKKAMGRAMGVVPATGNAKVAALASRTRDRIARAVDRSLGLTSNVARTSAKYVPAQTALLAQRIFDDGEPDAPKGAPITEQAAVRIRELSNYVHTPGAIERDVRRQLVDVTDPDLIEAAEKQRRVAMEYLLSVAPKGPDQGYMQTIKWSPSPAQAMSFARSWDAINAPADVWERFAQEHAMISLEAAQALRAVYPQLFSQAQQRVVERIAEANVKVPYRTRLQMSLLYQLPLDSALEPGNLKITQSVYERKPSSPAFNPAAAPAAAPPTATPSIAQPVDLSQAYMPTADRNAVQR